jgi:hypothetical protein
MDAKKAFYLFSKGEKFLSGFAKYENFTICLFECFPDQSQIKADHDTTGN